MPYKLKMTQEGLEHLLSQGCLYEVLFSGLQYTSVGANISHVGCSQSLSAADWLRWLRFLTGVERMMVAVDDDDDKSALLWGNMGFVPLDSKLLHCWAATIPAYSPQNTAGTQYLSMDVNRHTSIVQED